MPEVPKLVIKPVAVSTIVARKGTFASEIITNGKVYASHLADVRPEISEKINHIYVRNGDLVRKNQILASLDDSELKIKLQRAVYALDKSYIDLEDRLIDFGYRLKDTAGIPKSILRIAKVKSGHNEALYDFLDIKREIDKTKIVAPIDGRVMNLNFQTQNYIERSAKFCSVISDGDMLVDFNVLQGEYPLISKGTMIEVAPFGTAKFHRGKISDINPMIDNAGLIRITGIIANSGQFLNGMAVSIILKKRIEDKFVVPKSAIVKRQNRELVFLKHSDKAKWQYVVTGLQNENEVTIESGVRSGDTIITGNNLTLVHDSKVKTTE